MKTYTVHAHERTTRIVQVRAHDPEDAIERAEDTPDESTYTEGAGADVYDEAGQLVSRPDATIDTAEAVRRIHACMSAGAWNADTTAAIAGILADAGVPVADQDDEPEPAPGCDDCERSNGPGARCSCKH